MSSDLSCAQTQRLVFDDLRLEIALEGFSDSLATRLACAWLCRLASEATDFERFRFRLTIDPNLSYSETEIRESLLDGHLQYCPIDDGDRLELPGAQVYIWPDRDEAAITVHPDLLQPGKPRAALIQLAAEGALHRALLHCDAFLLHAAAFELEGLAILAIGPSGAGKSTLSAVALAAGGRMVSDDALIVFTNETGENTLRPSRPDLLFREPTPDLLTDPQRRSLESVTVGDTSKWRLARADVPQLFLPSLRPRVILLLDEKRSDSLIETTPADQSRLMAALIAASFAPYLSRVGYETHLQRLVDLSRQLALCARMFDVSVGTLQPGDSPDVAVELASELVAELVVKVGLR